MEARELRLGLEITCLFLLVLLLASRVENTRRSYCYACVYRLVGEQNNCLYPWYFSSRQILSNTLHHLFFSFLFRTIESGNPANGGVLHHISFSGIDMLIGELAHDRSLMKAG